MNKITVTYTTDGSNPYEKDWTYSTTLNDEEGGICEFHRFCKSLAAIAGYSTNTIEKYFGESCWE